MPDALPPPSRRKRVAAGDVAAQTLRDQLGTLAEVRAPSDAEEPILMPAVRQVVFEWMAEVNAAEELAAVKLRPRSTALLEGQPGTGKTTLAHHLAARLGVPLVLIGPENLNDMYVGQSERNAAKVFNIIRDADTPCVTFLDEFDSLGAKRTGAPKSGGGDARLAQLTVLLRKLEEHRGLLMAATNRAADIDPALWRRFHMQINVGLPGPDERYAILARYASPFEFGVDLLEALTDATAGASPALLRGLAEGIKRALVLAPRVRLDVGKPSSVIRRVVASLRPPPEFDAVALWRSDAIVAGLDDVPWPPTGPTPGKE